MPNWEEEAHDDDQHGYGYMVGATLPALLLTINEFILLQSNYHHQIMQRNSLIYDHFGSSV